MQRVTPGPEHHIASSGCCGVRLNTCQIECQNICQILSDKMPDRMLEHMSDRMLEIMSEYVSDITRSKAVLLEWLATIIK